MWHKASVWHIHIIVPYVKIQQYVITVAHHCPRKCCAKQDTVFECESL